MDDVTKEDLSGQLSPTSKADHSRACDPIAAASKVPQSSSTLTLRNAIVHVSPAEDRCDVETVETPTPPSHAFSQSSTTSDNNRSCEVVATEEHLAVYVDGRSEVPHRFQLTRSPTIRFGDSGETPLLDYPCQLDSSCDETELLDDELLSEDKSEAWGSRAAQPSPQISSSLPDSNDGHDIDATPNLFLPEPVRDQEEAVSCRDIEEDNSILVDTSHKSDEPCDEQSLNIARAAIQGSGTQNIPLQPKFQSGSSVITDAGDQQFKRQKRACDWEGPISQELGASPESSPTITSAPEYTLQHELNCQLFAALQRTRDPRDKGFLPKAQLDSLVNPESVSRELNKSLSQTLSTQQIKECADAVCTETEVVLSNGKKVIKSFRKIFALLVLVEKSSSIHLFLQEDVSDLDLPLETLRNGGLIKLRRRNTSGGPSNEVLHCFSSWSPVRRKEFEEYQWTMLAPFFSQSEYNNIAHYVLKDQHILPFVFTPEGEDENAEYQGGFGRVFMVRIHHEHHNFCTPTHCDRGFAIKQLLQNDRPSFKREVDILKKFSGEKSHPHVVSLLATYEQFNKFHLIFYRAEGNLFKYWGEINPSPEFNYGNVLWMAKQCSGIAHGLLRLHRHSTIKAASSIPHYDEEQEFKRRSTGEKSVKVVHPLLQRERETLRQSSGDKQIEPTSLPLASVMSRTSSEPQAPPQRRPIDGRPARWVNEPYSSGGDIVRQWGRHGDLKPENILWYYDPEEGKGILKISDFGEAELNSRWSKSKRRSHVANTMTYRPPECDLQPKIIRQSYDIWCLGCVYMEFVTWILGGVELWKKFGKKRLAWDVFQQTKTDTFFEIVKEEDADDVRVMVKESVTKFFNELHSHPNCTEYFHEFLDMIQHNMLVVEPGTVYKTCRMYCEEVSETLKDMYQKCCNDRDYATKKNPWTTKRLTAEPLTESVKVGMTDQAKEVIAKNMYLLRAHYGPTEDQTPPSEASSRLSCDT